MTNISQYTYSSPLNQFLMPYSFGQYSANQRSFPKSTVVVSIGDHSSRPRDYVQLWSSSHRAVSVCNSEDQRASLDSIDSIASAIHGAIQKEYRPTPQNIEISCADKNKLTGLIKKLKELYRPNTQQYAAK